MLKFDLQRFADDPKPADIQQQAKEVVTTAQRSPEQAEDMLRRILGTLEERHWQELRKALQDEMQALPTRIRTEIKAAMEELRSSPSPPLEGNPPTPAAPAGKPGIQVSPPQDNPNPQPSAEGRDAPEKPKGWFHRLMHEKR